MRRQVWVSRALAMTLGLAVVAGVALTIATRISEARAAAEQSAHRPIEARSDGYVSSRQCRACHPEQYESWHHSYHRTMTQRASPEAILGDFDDVDLVLDGETCALRRDREHAWVEMDLHDGAGRARHDIALVTGSHHMQVYWYPSGRTRTLAQVPFVWLIEERRWVPRNAAFLREPELARHPPSELARWNHTCLRCHATDPVAHMRGPLDTDTRVAELGISCEACHGPGEAHVRANADPARRYALHVRGGDDPTIVNPARLPAERASQACGHCHSVSSEKSRADWERWLAGGFDFRPGADLTATRAVIRHRERPDDELTRTIFALDPHFMEDRFWRDGMVRVTGRELGALVESPCYRSGSFSCLTCHSLHRVPDDARPARAWADDQLRKEALGDAVCVRCHEAIGRGVAAHTRHPAASAGSACMNCHMPFTTYGLQKAIRSHRISSPDAKESHSVGRPNACNLCHLDRTLAWTADRLAEWYGTARPELAPAERSIAAGHLWLLKGDAGQRALAAWSTGFPPAREASGARTWVPDLARLLDDPYESVRLIAWRSLRTLPGTEGIAYDYVGPRDERLRARAAVLERWRPEGGRPPLDGETFERLLRERDDRRVDLSE